MKEGASAVSLARKGDGPELLRCSPKREDPPSERNPTFRSAQGLTEPLINPAGQAMLTAAGNIEEFASRTPIKDLIALEPASKSEFPETGDCDTVCHPPDEAYVQDCYRRILDLGSNDSKTAVVDGINAILEEMADKAQMEDRSYTAMVDSVLMLHWTRKEGNSTSYDEFMQKHVDAISVLAKAWARDKTFGGRRIKVLEASCGTGAALEAFLDALPPRLLRKLRVTANDLSSAAIETTKKRLAKFAGKVRIEYEQKDLTQEIPSGKFDVIMLSQTLPFLNDENALRAQRLGLALPSESRHVTTKRKVLEGLINRLKPGKGELLLFDEYPMRFSKIPDDFDSIVEDSLFREIFRPISRGMLINDVMKRIEKARFHAHLESFIDREHIMYLIASGSLRHPENASENMEPPKAQQQGPREDENSKRIIKRAESMHRELIGRLQAFEEADGTVYRPISVGEKRLEIDKEYYDDKIDHKPGYWRTNGNYNLVIVDGLVHHVGQEGYRCMIEKLKRSHKLGPGSAILFIDEWPAPEGSPNPVGNGDARSLIFNAFDDQVFCASVRAGNKYGYLYVVRNL
ncbi:class I SAM-dependent methyltransferase [Candidatus Micrarchaeota archaeon]|nr:class I SAM-dependent methyltransferase [Candidatus Micrarchaeota archaeon]